MEKRVVVRYGILVLIFIGLVSILIVFRNVSFTGYAVFEQTSESNFSSGIYENTFYNDSVIMLSGENLSGNYTSQIFDAASEVRWNNLTWQEDKPYVKFLFAVDNTADVWKNKDEGVTWEKINDDYNGGDSNGVTTSFFNSTGDYFIVYNQDIWQSVDLGVSWSKINDDYNGAEGQNAFVAISDKNDNLYIIEGGQDVWKSSDSGVTWTKVSSDFNGGNGNFGGFVVNSSNVLIAADLAADIWKSDDEGASWTLIKDDYNGATGNNVGGMAIDKNDNLYILDLQDVWNSSDSGVTWSKVNDDFNGAGDSENAWAITTDSDNYVYIIDGGEDVFSSTDGGVTFTKVATNFNGAGLAVPTLVSLLQYTNLTFQVRNCSLSDCSGAEWQTTDLSNLNLAGRYFQYRVFFTSPDSSVTPQLSNVTIDYTTLNVAPSINIESPQDGATYIISEIIELNFTVNDVDNNIDSCWYSVDGGDNISLINCGNTTINAAIGEHIVRVYANDSGGAEGNASVSFSIINTAPSINLTSPQNGATYGYNESLALDFIVSDIDNNIDSCWYNIDNGENITLVNCVNITFNVSGDGDYILDAYVNDTEGEETNDSASFSVQIGAPTIILRSPIEVYLNSHNIEFSYTSTDIDLDSCELWFGNESSFELNQTAISVISGSENIFSLELEDGSYLWNIKCNDSQGNEAFNGNKTFYVDTLPPDLSLFEPKGTKTTRTITASWNISDVSPVDCIYNVYRGNNLEIGNTSVDCYLNSLSFNVTVDADFVFNFYVDDFAGNRNLTYSDFSVQTSTSESQITGGGGGGGGGAGGGSNISLEKLEIKQISNLIVNPRDTKKLSLSVKNIGNKFLNECKVKGEGKTIEWITSEDTKGLSVGEEYDFVFTLKTPENLEAGLHNVELSVVCKETSKLTSFFIEVIEKKLAIDLVDIERESKGTVKIVYSLTELSGIEQEVKIELILFDYNNERLAETTETKKIEANSNKQFEGVLDVEETLKGNYNLLINAISETSSTFLQEEIILGGSTIGGLAIFGEGDIAISIILLILFGIFVIFIIRRILKLRKLKKQGKKWAWNTKKERFEKNKFEERRKK